MMIGHAEQEAAFLAAFASGRLHHAWLLAGPRAMGKASFAERAASFLLTDDGSDPSPVSLDRTKASGGGIAAGLLNAGTHPERLVLRRLPNKDPSKPAARNITIDQVRALHGRMALSIGVGLWRVVIIDAIDDLEPVAANAILKLLEEPPASTVFFLVSHTPGALLPTIRSRCRLMRFSPLDADQMAAWLHGIRQHDDRRALDAIHRLSGGIPGVAHDLLQSGAGQVEGLLQQIARSGDGDTRLRQKLAQAMIGAANRPTYEAMLRQAPELYVAIARSLGDDAPRTIDDDWQQLTTLCAGAVRESSDTTMTTLEVGTLFSRLAIRA